MANTNPVNPWKHGNSSTHLSSKASTRRSSGACDTEVLLHQFLIRRQLVRIKIFGKVCLYPIA